MSGSKRPRLDVQVASHDADPSAAMNSLMTTFLTMNDDCIEAVLEWLDWDNLASISKTCKRLHVLANEFFQRKYPAAHINIWNLGDGVVLIPRTPWARTFSHLIKDVRISGEDINIYRRLAKSVHKQLRALHISSRLLSEEYIDCIVDQIEHVETMTLDDCMVANELHFTVLQYCKNMKRLHLKGFLFEDLEKKGLKYQWLQHTYRHLELLQLDDIKKEQHHNLIEFLRRNTTIKAFLSREMHCFAVTNVIIDANAQLDDLLLGLKESGARIVARLTTNLDNYYKGESFRLLKLKMIEWCDKLNAHHDQGNLKRLYLKTWHGCIAFDFADVFRKLRPLHGIDLSSESIEDKDVAGAIASFDRLKSLCLYTITKIEYAEILSKGLLNLEEIQLIIDTFETIYPFIRNSPKLQRMYFLCIRTGDTNINLAKLNSERAKLSTPEKLTLYIDHYKYLPLKEALGQLKYPFIEIEISEAHFKTNPSF